MAEKKGYWVARVDVSDPDGYKKYLELNQVAFAKFGARYRVRGGEFSAMEGESRARNVLIEFPSVQAAHDCYNSPEYKEAMSHRLPAGVIDLIIIEGYDGAQPGDA